MKNAISPTRQEDFSQWYQQVIKHADMAENAPVRGCMIIKPYGYAIWENIQRIFDAKIKSLGVQNAYFPLLIPLEFLTKEAEHIDGFAKECAVVTHTKLIKNENGDLVPSGELHQPYIIRPTSEAVIGNVVAKWITSYRDLPLKINQWCNVMRWEMRPRIFLRTSEFLWQEGHTIFETEEQAHNDAKKMHNAYHDFITNHLCLHAIVGEKTPEERFPGAKNTYTLEIMTQDGKALQGGTSHYLGQSFSSAFNIKFAARDGAELLAYTASWGISTRLIGALIMCHGDDNGLVLPPAIAPHQVVIIPIVHKEENRQAILDYVEQLKTLLDTGKIERTTIDYSEDTTPNKIWKWVKRGAPIRIEIGMREVENSNITFVCRHDTSSTKNQVKITQAADILHSKLQDIAATLLAKSKEYTEKNTKDVNSIDELDDLLKNNFAGFIKMPLTATKSSAFTAIAEKYGVSRRCIVGDNVIIAKSY
jgi:prolyl-tRNA synthetase